MDKQPQPVVVGHLIARPHRKPTRKNPHWSWRCRSAGVTVWTGRASPAEVARILAAKLIDEPDDEPAETIIETLGVLVDAWFTNEVAGRRKASTTNNYRVSARRVKRLVGSIRLDRGRWSLAELVRLMEEDGLALTTQQCTMTVTRMAWRWAHGYGFTDCPVPEAPRLTTPPKPRRRIPTVDEARRVIEMTYEPWRSILWCALATGARISEVALLELGDISDQAGRLVLTLGIHPNAEKTGERRVPITLDEAARALRKAVAEARLAGNSGRIWQHDRGAVSTNARTQIAFVLRELPWDEIGIQRITPKDLRALAVKMFRQAGVPLEVTAALMGHSIKVMLEYYRLIDEDERIDAMERARLGELGGVRALR